MSGDLLVTPLPKSPLDWSADGRFVLFSVLDPKSASDLWVLPMFGDRMPERVVQTVFDDVEGQFSPDGNWIAYASNESGRYEIYVRPFPSPGGKWQVSTTGGTQPRWGPKGNELYYVSPDNRLMSTPIRVLPDAHVIEPGTPVSLFSVHLAAGANVSVGSNTARAQYAVAADGRFLLVRSVDEAVGAPITIVLNWTAAATKK